MVLTQSRQWVDEAGFLSVHQMLELKEFAVEHDCRLVLTGDTKQHHSVQWGDALRILERSGLIAQGFPFFSLSASRYFGEKQTLCLYWPLATVVIAGPKVLDFYAVFCAHRATCLKADGNDIKVLNLILSGSSDGASETDPSKCHFGNYLA
jgi:hypothetical protein